MKQSAQKNFRTSCCEWWLLTLQLKQLGDEAGFGLFVPSSECASLVDMRATQSRHLHSTAQGEDQGSLPNSPRQQQDCDMNGPDLSNRAQIKNSSCSTFDATSVTLSRVWTRTKKRQQCRRFLRAPCQDGLELTSSWHPWLSQCLEHPRRW